MAVFRIVTLVCVLATCGAAAAAPRSNASKPTEWRSYYLLDVRNSRGPVALLKDVAHRTHLLLRSGGSWHDATPHGLTWWIEDVYFLDQRRGWLVANDCAAAKGVVYPLRMAVETGGSFRGDSVTAARRVATSALCSSTESTVGSWAPFRPALPPFCSERKTAV